MADLGYLLVASAGFGVYALNLRAFATTATTKAK